MIYIVEIGSTLNEQHWNWTGDMSGPSTCIVSCIYNGVSPPRGQVSKLTHLKKLKLWKIIRPEREAIPIMND